jgi:hypothetical protein
LQPHQPLDPVQSTFGAFRQQIAPDTPRTIGSVTGNKACLDLLAQSFVAAGSGAGGSVQPGMEA